MLTPEAVCENIANMKSTERLENLLDEIDKTKINGNSHGLIIKKGAYVNTTLLLCALMKNKFNLVEKIIIAADAESIDVYAALPDSAHTVISLIPNNRDDLVCLLIPKVKVIHTEKPWISQDGLLIDVIVKGKCEILQTLIQKGYVDIEIFKDVKGDNEAKQTLNDNIRSIINNYLNAIECIERLPNPQSFTALLKLFSENSWLFDGRKQNDKVTFKDLIINRLNQQPPIFKNQLRQFYKRFPQFKPEGFQVEDPISAPPTPSLSPTLPAAAPSSAMPLQPHQNGVVLKKELTLSELLCQGKREILIKKLQKGEIDFALLDPFAEDPEIDFSCKNVITICLQWRNENFELPKSNAFQNILTLFENNEWLFTVHDFFSKKSLLELTRSKLRIKPQQLKQFNEKFPDCDSLLNHSNDSELKISDEELQTNGAAKRDDALGSSDPGSAETREPMPEVSTTAITPKQVDLNHEGSVLVAGVSPAAQSNGMTTSEQRDATLANNQRLTASIGQSAYDISKEGDETFSHNGQLAEAKSKVERPNADNFHRGTGPAPHVSDADKGNESDKDNVPLAQRMRAALKAYNETHTDDKGSSKKGDSSLVAFAQKYQEDLLKKTREEQLRKQREEEAALAEANRQRSLEAPTSDTDVSSSLAQDAAQSSPPGGSSEPILSELPKKDLILFFNEQKDALTREIYNQEISLYENKKLKINKVKKIFSNLYSVYKDDNKSINQYNRHELLDVFCEFYKNISAEDHKKKIDIHSHPTYDRFFRKPNTHSWQEMVKEMRKLSLDYLLAIAAEQFNSQPDQAASFLNNYLNEPLFCEHRSNVAICRIGDTSAVKQIKGKIAEYRDAIKMTKRGL